MVVCSHGGSFFYLGLGLSLKFDRSWALGHRFQRRLITPSLDGAYEASFYRLGPS